MAEFCLLGCNRFHGCNLTAEGVVLTDYQELCEDCGEMQRTIIRFRHRSFWAKLKNAWRK